MTRAAGWPRGLAVAATALLAALATPPAGGQTTVEPGVRYRSAETIYLDAGSAAGVAVGDRFAVWRDGRAIGEVEVIFVAERSASARAVTETEPIRPGDRLRRLGPPRAPSGSAAGASVPPPGEGTGAPSGDPAAERAPAADRSATAPPVPPTPRRTRTTRASGTFNLEWRGTGAGAAGDESRDSSRTTARLNLRVRDLGGTPLQLRVRGRLMDLTREGQRAGLPADESRDRLYEAAVIWDEPGSLLAARAGRLGGAPLLSLGYLDGALVEVRPIARLAAGAVYGRRAEDAALGGDAGGTKAGAYLRLGRTAGEEGTRSYGVTVAGFQESADDPRFDRTYVALESHVDGGGRWAFFQHAELDLDVPAGTAAAADAGGQQLSLASLTLLRRGERGGRLALSYDRFQSYPTEEDVSVPVAFLDRFARQGLRLGWSREGAGGLRLALEAGARFREDAPPIHPQLGPFADAETTFSLRAGAHHGRLPGGLTAGVDVTAFGSASADGAIAALRLGKRFAAGHEVDLAVGGTLWEAPLDERTLGWGRLSLWVELPADLFARGDLELLVGEGLDGQRASLGLGYRL